MVSDQVRNYHSIMSNAHRLLSDSKVVRRVILIEVSDPCIIVILHNCNLSASTGMLGLSTTYCLVSRIQLSILFLCRVCFLGHYTIVGKSKILVWLWRNERLRLGLKILQHGMHRFLLKISILKIPIKDQAFTSSWAIFS